MLTNFVAVALLISVSQNRPFLLATRPFEFARKESKKPHLVEYDGVGSGTDSHDSTPEASGARVQQNRGQRCVS
jgi:hypothetical protein